MDCLRELKTEAPHRPACVIPVNQAGALSAGTTPSSNLSLLLCLTQIADVRSAPPETGWTTGLDGCRSQHSRLAPSGRALDDGRDWAHAAKERSRVVRLASIRRYRRALVGGRLWATSRSAADAALCGLWRHRRFDGQVHGVRLRILLRAGDLGRQRAIAAASRHDRNRRRAAALATATSSSGCPAPHQCWACVQSSTLRGRR